MGVPVDDEEIAQALTSRIESSRHCARPATL